MAVAACVLPTLRPVADSDVWWHLAAGRAVLTGSDAAFREAWSFTAAGARWINHEWLAEAALAAASRAGGTYGLILLSATLLALTALLLFRAATRDGLPPWLAALLVALAAAAASDRFIPRPQLFSYLGVAFLCDTLSRARRTGRIPWELLPAQVVWTNAHGPVLGLLFGGLLLIGGAVPALSWRARIGLVGALLVASCVHPQGILPLWDNARHLAGGGLYRQTIREWLPLLSPEQHGLPQAPATWGVVAVALIAVGTALRDRRRLQAPGPLLLLALAAAAPLLAVRNRDLAALLLAPSLAALGTCAAPFWRRLPATLVTSAAAVALVLLPAAGAGRYAPLLPLRPGLSAAEAPVGAVQFLKREPVGRRIFNVYDHGGYLIHELGPARTVFIDGRYFVYGEALYREYLELRDAIPDVPARLRERDPDLLLLRYPAADGYMGLARLAATWPDWHLVYWDDATLLYARNGAAAPEWLSAHRYEWAHPLTSGSRVSDPEWWRAHFGAIVRECLRARADAPTALRPRLTLALALEYAGRDGEAGRAYEEVLALNPASRPARDGLSRLRERNPGGLTLPATLSALEQEAGPIAPPAPVPR